MNKTIVCLIVCFENTERFDSKYINMLVSFFLFFKSSQLVLHIWINTKHKYVKVLAAIIWREKLNKQTYMSMRYGIAWKKKYPTWFFSQQHLWRTVPWLIKCQKSINYRISVYFWRYLIFTSLYFLVDAGVKVHTSIAYQFISNRQCYLVFTTIL